MKIVISSFVFAILALLSTGCGSGSSNGNAQVEACVSRGIAYFKENGSYPTLSSAPNTGRSADQVARKRCNRTTTAI